MIASTVSSVEVGDEFEKLPSHLTVIPWFALDEQRWPELDAHLKEMELEYPAGPFPRAFVGDRVKYGPENDIEAHRVMIDAIGGFPLYASLYGMIRHLGSELDTTYAGMSWPPHMNDTVDQAHQEDQLLRFDNLTVFQHEFKRMKRVKALYRWGVYVDETAS